MLKLLLLRYIYRKIEQLISSVSNLVWPGSGQCRIQRQSENQSIRGGQDLEDEVGRKRENPFVTKREGK